MIPAAFDYVAPTTLDEALELLARHGDDAKVLAGGHSLLPLLKLRLARPGIVIDLRRIRDLTAVRTAKGLVEIGALVTHAAIAESEELRRLCPLLAETAEQIGDVQVRNAGTLGGSVVHADPAADWPAPLLALEATMLVAGPSGRREVAAADFFLGPLQSAVEEGEILTGLRVTTPPRGEGFAYRKAKQQASGFAIAGVAVQLGHENGRVVAPRVAVTGVAATPYRAVAVEEALRDAPADEASVRAACDRAADGVEPLEDLHAGAAYRAHLATVLARRAVLAAVARARGASA